MHCTRATAALLLSLCGLAHGARPATEEGAFSVDQFSARTYQGSPQNWASVQDARGILYFANTSGVIEYDGVTWTHIPVPQGFVARSLARDSRDRILVGGQNDFGVLEPDTHGQLRFRSLLSFVPEPDRNFGDVLNIIAAPDGVYFSTPKRLLRWDLAQGIRVWRPAVKFSRAYLAGTAVYVAEPEKGLEQPGGAAIEPIPGGDEFHSGDLRGAFLWGNRLTIATNTGLFQRQQEKFVPFSTAAAALIRESRLYCVLPLSADRLAVGTVNGGLLLIGPDGHVDRVLRKDDGLPADWITSLYSDRLGGLWITTSSGIAHLKPWLTRFSEKQGLHGGVISLGRQAGALYAGTETGLFVLTAKTGGAPSEFQPVPGLVGQTFVLLPSATGLLAGSVTGLFLVQNGAARSIQKTDVVYDLSFSPRDPDVLYAVGRAGLTVLRRDKSQWKVARSVPSGGAEFRTVLEDRDGRVWVSTPKTVHRIDLAADPPRVETYGSAANVPAGFNSFFRLNGRVVLATRNGLLEFSGPSGKFVGETQYPAWLADGSRGVDLVREDPAGNAWFSGPGYHGLFAGNPPRWRPMPLAGSGLTELYALQVDADGTVWAAGPEGWLARYQASFFRAPVPALSAIIRRVEAQGEKDPVAGGAAGSLAAPRLPYRQNALRFEFAAPFFDGEGAAEYQFQLEGLRDTWSNWSHETHADFTNITEGSYTFRVRARHPELAGAAEAAFRFSIMPPWFRTWWAYLLYAAAMVAAVWGLFHWRLRRLEESNRRLEALVDERTTEVRRQRDEIRAHERKTEALLLNILPAQVAAELRETGAVAPMGFDNVTVCMTDFQGFTLSSEKLPPRELIDALNEYFTAFDEIIARYGLERLKTIGDAYMFAAGLPRPRRSHAVDAALAATEIARIVEAAQGKRAGISWKIRIGLNSGPVVAGVVGIQKFAFDIWGNTVNLASRMESSGAAGRVNVSTRTYEEIREFIDCEPRGLVHTKDGRDLEMYFVRGVREELLNGDSGLVPEAFASLYRERFGVVPPAFPTKAPREALRGNVDSAT